MTLRATAIAAAILICATAQLSATGRAEVPRQPAAPPVPAVPAPEAVPEPEIVPVAFVSGHGAGEDDPFWMAFEQGLRSAADEAFAGSGTHRYLIHREGPFHRNAVDLQINLVEQALTRDIAALVVAPLDGAALAPQLTGAQRRGIHVVIIGNAEIPGLSRVSMDHHQSGVLAAQRIRQILPDRTVAIVGTAGAEIFQRDSEHRKEGAISVLGPSPVTPILVALPPERFVLVLADLLLRPAAVSGVIALDGQAATAATAVARETGRAGELVVVAMNPHREVFEGMRQGEIAAIVADQPRLMGAQALQVVSRGVEEERNTPEVVILDPLAFAIEDLEDETIVGILRDFDLPDDARE